MHQSLPTSLFLRVHLKAHIEKFCNPINLGPKSHLEQRKTTAEWLFSIHWGEKCYLIARDKIKAQNEHHKDKQINWHLLKIISFEIGRMNRNTCKWQNRNCPERNNRENQQVDMIMGSIWVRKQRQTFEGKEPKRQNTISTDIKNS